MNDVLSNFYFPLVSSCSCKFLYESRITLALSPKYNGNINIINARNQSHCDIVLSNVLNQVLLKS